MDASQMITMLRDQTKTTVSMISDATLATYIDIIHKKVYKKIVNLDRNYFWNRRTSNLVANQEEYTLMLPGGGSFGQWSIEKIGIKYNVTDEYYTDVTLRTRDELEYDASVYAENQPQSTPFAIISDKSVFIFPTPGDNIAWWLKLEWSRRPYTIDENSVETGFLCPVEYHYVLVLWAIYYVLWQRSLESEANNATNMFEKELNEMLFDISSRETTAIKGERQSLSYLE